MVAGNFIRVPQDPLIERIAAGSGMDAADDWIAERAGAFDIVITADIPLASRCVKAWRRGDRAERKAVHGTIDRHDARRAQSDDRSALVGRSHRRAKIVCARVTARRSSRRWIRPSAASSAARGPGNSEPELMAPPLIQLKDIALTFGGTPLLTGVELSVSAGERVCLIGRNGSGKSTLLKIAAGLVEPDGGSRFVQPGATIRYLPQEPDFADAHDDARLMSRPASAPATTIIRRAICWSSSACTATKTPRTSPAARRAARRWRGCWRPRPTSCCWTSRPTISICRPSNGWKANCDSRSSALVLISHDRRFLGNLSRATAWLDRGKIKQIDRGFGAFEAWRDEVLAEEEREQHKLDRKIVNEEHWLRYGVSGRRKRNVKRLGNLHALRDQRRNYRGAAGNANLAAAEAENPAGW